MAQYQATGPTELLDLIDAAAEVVAKQEQAGQIEEQATQKTRLALGKPRELTPTQAVFAAQLSRLGPSPRSAYRPAGFVIDTTGREPHKP